MAMARNQHGLTAKESKIALYKAQGMTQSDAYRKAYNTYSQEPKTVWSEASKIFARPKVAARVRKLLDEANVQDIISVGRWAELVLDGVEQAKEDGNLTAFFNGTRQLGQWCGALKENVSLTMEAKTSDKALLEQWSKDKDKLALAREMLGAEDTFDQSIDKAGVERERQYEQARKASETTKSQGQDDGDVTGQVSGTVKAMKVMRDSQAKAKAEKRGGKPKLKAVREMLGAGDTFEQAVDKAGIGHSETAKAPWATDTERGKAEVSQAFKAGEGGEVIQPCDGPETLSQSHAALSIVPEAKDTFDA